MLGGSHFHEYIRENITHFTRAHHNTKTNNDIRSIVEMKMEGKHPGVKTEVEMEGFVRSEMKAWKIGDKWATEREKWNGQDSHTQGEGIEM